MIPKYSICMINLNMDNTIKKSVSSIAEQLDENYEIVIYDGGSNDQSISIIKNLSNKYNNIPTSSSLSAILPIGTRSLYASTNSLLC